MANLPSIDPNQPIPNGPFSSPETWALLSPIGPLITGSGICISSTGVVSASGGGGGGGTVTSVATGSGLTGGPISTTGTISLDVSGVTAGVYQRANVTVDVYGRVTAISSNPAPGTVCQITAGTGLSGGVITDTGTIALCDTTVTPGSYTNSSFTVDAQGRLTAASSGTAITSITAGTGLSGGTITSSGTIALAPSGVTAGTYTSPEIVVDAQGRILSAVDCSYVSNIATGTGLTGGPISSTGTIALADTSVSAGTYSFPTITVDAQGRLTNASGNTAVTCVCAGTGLTGGPISSTGTLSLETLVPDPSGLYALASVTLDAYGRVTSATANDLFAAISTVAPLAITGSATSVSLSVDNATTSAPGVVTLVDNLTTNSTTTALTAAQGYALKQQLDALAIASNLTFAGTLDAATGNILSVSAEGALAGFTVGSPLPAAATGNVEYFVIVTTPGTYTPPGGSSTTAAQGDWFLSDGSAWEFLNVGFDAPSASTTTPGIVQLATTAETQTGTSSSLAVTPVGAAGTYIPKSDYTALGEIQVGTGAGTYSALSVGADGQVLTANSGATAGVEWVTSGQLCGYTDSVAPLNTALGFQAGDSITTGTDNVTIGYNAGTSITTGSQNVVIGSNTSVSSNAVGVVAVGFCAGQAVTTGGCVVHIGWVSGRNSTGLSNTYVGALTGCAASNTSGCGTLFGFCAGSALTSGNGNTLLGHQAGRLVTTGCFNVAIGVAAFQTATTGVCNVAIGCGALSGGNITGCGSTAIGTRALGNTSGTAVNTAVGSEAGAQTSGTGNSYFGVNAGCAVNTGTCNTLIGRNSGTAITTGSCNTILGSFTGAATLANNVVLADGAGTVRFQANGSGAWAPNGVDFGTAGQVLSSQGSGSAPVWTTLASGGVASVSGTSPITVDSTNPTAPVVEIDAASTSQAGAVQLEDTVTSTSTTLAATANAVKTVNDAVVIAQADATQALSDAASAQATADAAVPDSTFTALGDLIVGTGAGLPVALAVGTDGQVLTACSTCAEGVTWAAGGGGAPIATPTTYGTVFALTDRPRGNYGVGCCVLNRIDSSSCRNVAMGFCAMGNLTAGACCNTSLGDNAMQGGSTGAQNWRCNVAIGWGTMQTSTAINVINNVYVGHSAGQCNSGCHNTGIGFRALQLGTSSVGNTAVGALAGSAGTTGCYNSLFGCMAGCAITSGSGNVVLGGTRNDGVYNPVFNVITECNRVVVGSAAVTNAYVQVAWTVVSDARDKIVEGDVPHGLDFVDQLEPKAFRFKGERDSDVPNGPLRYGFLAQDVLALEGGEGVIIDAEDPDKLRYNGEALVPVLVNAIKELSAKNDELEARIRALEIPG